MSIRIVSKDITVEFGVCRLPHRTNKCLYTMRGAILEPLAYFRNDEDAERFEKIIDLIYELLTKG